MNWYVYSCTAIDYNWEHLLSAAQTASQLEERAARLASDREPATASSGEHADTFVAAWKSARHAALEHAGWEGDFKQEPVVFWLPDENRASFVYGFAFKQGNNGQTFIISPLELVWLGRPMASPPPPPPRPSILRHLLD